MNWERGLKRVAFGFLGVIWAVVLTIGATDGPAAFGYCVLGMLVFSFCYGLLFSVLAWVVRGFTGDKRPTASS